MSLDLYIFDYRIFHKYTEYLIRAIYKANMELVFHPNPKVNFLDYRVY